MTSLIIYQSDANIDVKILEEICHPLNPNKIGKKGSHKRKDGTICTYYNIATNTRYGIGNNEPRVLRFNELMNIAMMKYNFITLII